nr:ABC transporter ATP-binding protein [Tissierella sp.]
MKELLLRKKSRFIFYLIACFIPVVDSVLINLAVSLIIGSVESQDLDRFFTIVAVTLGIIIFGTLMYILSRFMRITFMRDILLDVRVLAFDKILGSSYKQFSSKSRESYISNLINDINIFENEFFLKLINVIYRGGVFVVSIIIIGFLDIKFALISLVASIVLFVISKSFEKKTVRLQEEVSESNEDISIELSNTFNGLEILKLNNIEDRFLKNSLKSITVLEKKKFSYNVYTNSQRQIMEFLGFGFLIGSIIYISSLISQGMTFTKATFIIQLSNGCIWHITSILPLFNELKSSANIFDKITKREEVPIDSSREKHFNFDKEIKVRNLTFDYGEKEIFKDVSFNIEKGKKYLLKGASGAGKSTLIKLLSMVYNDYQGDIETDGLNYNLIKETSLNDKVSFIYQDVFLFEDSIFNNIALYKDYSEEEVLNAAHRAGLDSLLRKKEAGIEEKLMENGKNLSGGERQRISIARAIIKKSQILFVDEGTSSLDEELGRLVEDTILSLDSTVISISHRYYEGITEKYDYVLEIKNGKLEQYKSKDYFREVAI